MGDKTRGLYPEGKFIVRRRDGTDVEGGKHDGCEYFVLDITHDPHAVPALRSYAASARTDGYELLANDLERVIAATPPTATAAETTKCEHCHEPIAKAIKGGWIHAETTLNTCRRSDNHEEVFYAAPYEPDIYDAVAELRARDGIVPTVALVATTSGAREAGFPRTTYKNKRQLSDKERWQLNRALNDYMFNNCDHEHDGYPNHLACRWCVLEIIAAITAPSAVPVEEQKLHWPFAARHEHCAECDKEYEPVSARTKAEYIAATTDNNED